MVIDDRGMDVTPGGGLTVALPGLGELVHAGPRAACVASPPHLPWAKYGRPSRPCDTSAFFGLPDLPTTGDTPEVAVSLHIRASELPETHIPELISRPVFQPASRSLRLLQMS